jgi:signal transduction histidine kinase
VLLIDSEGKLLTNVGLPPEEGNLLDHAGVQAAIRGETGSTFLPAEDGEHVVAFSSILPTNWGLIIEETWEDVSSPLLDISLITPLSLAPILLVAMFALWFGARRVVQPLRNLENQAEKLASGDYEAIEESAGGIAEIQSLQQTLVSMARRIQTAQQALRGYIGSITRTQEEERRRLARDLHDETIQDLIALDQQIQMIGMNQREANASGNEAIDKLHHDTQEAIQKVRRLSRGLRPIYLEDLGLIPALEMLAKDVQTDLQIPISFEVQGSERRLDPAVEVAVYRIVQETLSNIGRHAGSTKAWIDMNFTSEALQLTVRDNGTGFELPPQTSELAYGGHYGLIGMHERVELIKGNLEIKSIPGQGTTISIYVPLAFDRGNLN